MSKTPKNIIHIYSDPKFIYFIDSYRFHQFNNELVYIGDSDNIPLKFKKNAHLLAKDSANQLNQLLEICKTADLLIVNFLNKITVKLILSLPEKIKIIWRFYGAEIYTREPDLFYSKETLKYWKTKKKNTSVMHMIIRYFRPALLSYKNIKLLLSKIDFFLGVMEDEHTLLKNMGYDLPTFLQFPIGFIPYNQGNFKKSSLIIFGNSRNKDNNHLDVLKLFRNTMLPNELKIKMFFSYGIVDEYSHQVKKESEQIPEIELIETFLPKEEFIEIYHHAAALVINGYRQMALDNIVTALMNGVKIYLSEKNVTYSWATKNNFLVYSIENDLEKDLKCNNIFLSASEKQNNFESLQILMREHSLEKFQNQIIRIVNSE
ncbi:hypothetical protein H4O20_08805 [Aequorivita sp. 609]|uniref:hypothetical protein n=1 Tax=Aequorivita TaxID=153265 RepID=UPI00160D5DEC|nr:MULTISPECIES: hypothetical protein [Aequorivita]MBB6681541.1 hypothetical protein [Aequorivita sp. 609]